MTGIICQSQSFLPTTTLLAVGTLFFLHLRYNKKLAFQKTLYFALYVLIAAGGAYLHKSTLKEYDNFYLFTQNKPITITGTIINKSIDKNQYNSSTIITLALESMHNQTDHKNINKKIILYGPLSLDVLCVGDNVTFFNILCKKSENESLNLYQMKEHIAATVFDQKIKYTINTRPTWSFQRWIFNHKEKLLYSLKQKLSPSCFLFFASLFLGNRACVKNSMEETNEQFKRWGIFHLLSRSGMHLALFIFSWQLLLRTIPLPFIIKQLILLIISFIYGFFSWSSTPFIRSFVLFLFNRICLITKTSYLSLHYLPLTCLCFLVYCPLYLFFLDFQLTFSLTFALIWLNQVYNQWLYSDHQTKQLNY